jgi:multiple sugar transport system permease protein
LGVPTLIVPFYTWVIIGYFASIRKELDEAPLIDGARGIQMLVKISYPVALAGIIAATIFCFVVSRANLLYGLGFTTSTDRLTLPVEILPALIRDDLHAWRKS